MSNRQLLLSDNPIISIGIICYNQGKYISKAIESILNQNFDLKYELIIIDDCSTDNTKEVCEKYVNCYSDIIMYTCNKTNKGVVKNLFEVLLPICRGEFIALCAGDDYWLSTNKLKKQYEILIANQKISVVHTAYRKYFENIDKYEDVLKWNSPLLKESGVKAIKYVLKENFSSFPVGSSIMFRNKEIEKHINSYSNIINQRDIPGEGMILFSFFALDGYFYFLEDVSTVYLIRENSLSHIKSDKEKIVFDIHYILQKVYISDTLIHNNLITLRLGVKLLYILYDSINEKCVDIYLNTLKSSSDGLRLKSIYFIYYTSLIITKNPILKSLFTTIFKMRYKK